MFGLSLRLPHACSPYSYKYDLYSEEKFEKLNERPHGTHGTDIYRATDERALIRGE